MKTNTTNSVIIQASAIFPVFLPETTEDDARWVNLSAARYFTLIKPKLITGSEPEPTKVIVCWGENDWDEYTGIQAIALMDALESFPFGSYPNE